MLRTMLKSKIHRATLTGLELHYEGSIAIDPVLLEKADMAIGEQVQILNLNNAARFNTYVIEGERGTGQIMLNGPAARLGVIGDQVIIITYCQLDENEMKHHKPNIVHVDAQNRPLEK